MRWAAAVQSRLAGYLMSLVIGLQWPPRIPALLLLMCAGTQRWLALPPPHILHLSFPHWPIYLSLNPPLSRELIQGAHAAPSLLLPVPRSSRYIDSLSGTCLVTTRLGIRYQQRHLISHSSRLPHS